MSAIDLVIAGAQGGTNVGDSFYQGSQQLGIRAELVDTRTAYSRSLLARFKWHFMGRRPAGLSSYSRVVEATVARQRPRWFLSVGIAPIHVTTVRRITEMGIPTFNFLTDDPFNPVHRGRWALESLKAYSTIFSPRLANMNDLRRLGCRDVQYLPFGYDPRHCFSEEPEAKDMGSDVIFVGGADSDRLPWIRALLEAGLKVALYGSYWERFEVTRTATRGQAEPEVIRRATASAKIALCLVRRANRDGHVMRSLEIPAIGTCMLVEDTQEHRSLFGADGESVIYFQDERSMVAGARRLLTDEPARHRLARAVHERIHSGRHTYADRLRTILNLDAPQSASVCSGHAGGP